MNEISFSIISGVFNGPDIDRVIKDGGFDSTLTEEQAIAWDAMKMVFENVFGNHRAENFRVLVQDMLTAFEAIGMNVSLKIHFLICHLDRFAAQISTESDQEGERFHQVCKPMETRYKGKHLESMMADLCWSLYEDENEFVPRSKRQKH